MNKYRVLKTYPKQITNSGRLLTLKEGKQVYLKRESQVLRLIRMGIIKPIVEIKKRPKSAKKANQARKQAEESQSQSEDNQSNKKRRSEYLNKKNKGGSSN